MGLFDKIANIRNKPDAEFIRLVKAMDDGEDWALQRMSELWETKDATLYDKIDQARLEIYEKAAQQGDDKSQYFVGLALQRTNPLESINALTALAYKGYIPAMLALSVGYTEFGFFGDDPEKSRYWKMKAAEAGDTEAQVRLGLDYLADNDVSEALRWYSLAAEKGDSDAAIGVANCYRRKRDELRFSEAAMELDENQRKAEEYEDLMEQYLAQAASCCKTMQQRADAYKELGLLYAIWAQKTGDINFAKRAVYFLYVGYQCSEYKDDYIMERYYHIVDEFNIAVDTSDIEGWADREVFNE